MPQIRLVSESKSVRDKVKKENIGQSLIDIVEAIWPQAKKDVTYTFIPAFQTINECDIQIEVRYDEGYEYEKGKKFKPNKKDKEEVADAIGAYMRSVFPELSKESIAIWITPYKETVFKIF